MAPKCGPLIFANLAGDLMNQWKQSTVSSCFIWFHRLFLLRIVQLLEYASQWYWLYLWAVWFSPIWSSRKIEKCTVGQKKIDLAGFFLKYASWKWSHSMGKSKIPLKTCCFPSWLEDNYSVKNRSNIQNHILNQHPKKHSSLVLPAGRFWWLKPLENQFLPRTISESPHGRSSFRCRYGGYLWTFSWHGVKIAFCCYKYRKKRSSLTFQIPGERVLFEEAKGFESFVEKPMFSWSSPLLDDLVHVDLTKVSLEKILKQKLCLPLHPCMYTYIYIYLQ